MSAVETILRAAPPTALRRGANQTRPYAGDGHEDTIAVTLTRDVVGLVDAADWYDVLHRYRWHAHLSPAKWGWNDRWVMRATVRGRRQALAHVMVSMLAGFDSSDVVDHIEHRQRDEMLIDNRRSNLRPASHAENGQNSRAAIQDGFRGTLLLPSGRWRAAIRYAGKRIHLGVFDTEEQAAAAYDGAAKIAHGEFAITNLAQDESGVPF